MALSTREAGGPSVLDPFVVSLRGQSSSRQAAGNGKVKDAPRLALVDIGHITIPMAGDTQRI